MTHAVICWHLIVPKLSEKEARVLFLVRQGLKESDIAKELKIARGTVSSLKQRGVKKMRLILRNLFENIGAANQRYLKSSKIQFENKEVVQPESV